MPLSYGRSKIPYRMMEFAFSHGRDLQEVITSLISAPPKIGNCRDS